MNVDFGPVEYNSAVLGEEKFSVVTTPTNGFTTKAATLILDGAFTYRVKYAVDSSLEGKTLYAEYYSVRVSEETENPILQGSVALTPTGDGTSYYARITGIAAKDMDEAIVIKPYYLNENGEKVYGAELVYSGYEYVRRTLASSSSDETLKDTAKALAMYIHCADEALTK